MASRFYATSVGGRLPKDVTEAGSTNSVAVELAVDLTKVTDKTEVINQVRAILLYLETSAETNPVA